MKENSSNISTIVKGVVFICCIAAVVCGYVVIDYYLNRQPDVDAIEVTGADGTTYTSYRTACSKGDFDAAREFVEKMKERAATAKFTSDKNALMKNIPEAEEYIFSSELNALASMNDEQANTRIILVINEDKAEGSPVNEGADIGKDCLIRVFGEGNNEAYKKYMNWVSKFNLKCDRVLDIAIACENKELAEKVMTLIRPNATFYYKPSSQHANDSDYKDVYAHYTTDSKDAAQKKYEEAVKSGAFNK